MLSWVNFTKSLSIYSNVQYSWPAWRVAFDWRILFYVFVVSMSMVNGNKHRLENAPGKLPSLNTDRSANLPLAILLINLSKHRFAFFKHRLFLQFFVEMMIKFNMENIHHQRTRQRCWWLRANTLSETSLGRNCSCDNKIVMCYGNFELRHVLQPKHISSARLSRHSVHWLHVNFVT